MRTARTPVGAMVELTAAFSTVPAGDAAAIERLLADVAGEIGREDGMFTRARVLFTESDERCGLSAELDGVKKEAVPLELDIGDIEEATTSAAARARLKAALRRYFERVRGRGPEA